MPKRINHVAQMRLTKENLQKSRIKGHTMLKRKDEKIKGKSNIVGKSKKIILDNETDPLLD